MQILFKLIRRRVFAASDLGLDRLYMSYLWELDINERTDFGAGCVHYEYLSLSHLGNIVLTSKTTERVNSTLNENYDWNILLIYIYYIFLISS